MTNHDLESVEKELRRLREAYTDGKSSTCEAFADACYDVLPLLFGELKELRAALDRAVVGSG